MNEFFKTFFASLLAFFAGGIILVILSVMLIVGLIATIGSSFETQSVSISKNSVLRIDFKTPIIDSPESVSAVGSIDFTNMQIRTSMTLLEMLNAIEYATTDPKISGILLDVSTFSGLGVGMLEEIRSQLVKFKESGKFIVSYGETYSHGSYYLSSVADPVLMNPHGGVQWTGLSSNVMFYKGLLDKLGIKTEVLRHGSFKSAVEPFILEQMSPENRLQLNTLMGSVWGTVVGDIAQSRNLDSTKMMAYASDLNIESPEDALRLGFVDSLVYGDQVDRVLNSLTYPEDSLLLDKKPAVVTLAKYISSNTLGYHSASDNIIGIVYADGEIVDGEAEAGSVGSRTFRGHIIQARDDDKIKAVVIRINSPGGSALASETMWREIKLLQAKKPVVVSMGSVAASGGYYIAAPADAILANRMTITGSIGVFGLIFNVGKGLNDKLGVSVDVAKTNPSADMGMGVSFREMTAGERAFGMKQVERTYFTFVDRVSTGRNMTPENVDNIGQGRVWSGSDALGIGLIDGFGGLKDAISLAADRAEIVGDFRIEHIVKKEESLMSILRQLSNTVRTQSSVDQMGDLFIHYNRLRTLMNDKGVQARLPYTLEIE